MFGFSWFKTLASLAVVVAVGMTIYMGYKYVSDIQLENSRLTTSNATLSANNSQLEQAIDEQQDTIEGLQADIEAQSRIFQQTNDQFRAARAQVDRLRERLARQDLSEQGLEDPDMVEEVINQSTRDINRCFEIASGSPLTESEKNATLENEINQECPELANPNFEGNQ